MKPDDPKPAAVRGVLLALLSGFLNGHAFVYGGWAALLANVPLLIALRHTRTPGRAALLGGLVGFLGGAHIYGIVDYGWLLFWAFSLYTASQMVIYALAFLALWKRLTPWMAVLLPAALWTLTEWIRTLGPLCMPASYAGCVADVPFLRPLLALAPYTGGLGVSTVVALTQSVVFHLGFGERAHRKPALWAGAVVLFACTLGLWHAPPLGDTPVEVAGVQGGLPNSVYAAALADPAVSHQVIETYATLTREASKPDVDLIVWPETALRVPVLASPTLRAQLLPDANQHATLIAGLPYDAEDGSHHNSAVVIRPGGVVTDRYDKVRLVLGNESTYEAGTVWRPVETPFGPVGVLICLESVYPEVGRTLTLNGAELLAVISNDAGFGKSPIAHHMTNRAIIQAVENGRWLIRVGQSGISTLIDPTGETHGRLDLFEHGVLRGTARRRSDLTLYTRWGDWWMAVIGVVLAAAVWQARRREVRP